MKQIRGILALLVLIFIATAFLDETFLDAENIENLLRRVGLYGVMSIGVAFVIMTGGIDLSIGSVIGLIGCSFPAVVMALSAKQELGPGMLALLILGALVLSASLGLIHGLLVTKVRLQPFVVTLCGLLIYRGVVRGLLHGQSLGFGDQYQGLRWLARGGLPIPFIDSGVGDRSFMIPAPFLILVVIALLAALFLNRTVWGRHLKALGRNEEAARYSGIATHRLIILAYVVSALLAGLSGILFVVDNNLARPSSFGNFYELYAIAAAVLGGCSLRGGEGTILGVIIGTAVMRVLRNSINVIGIPTQLEFAVSGAVILLGVMADELVRGALRRRRRR